MARAVPVEQASETDPTIAAREAPSRRSRRCAQRWPAKRRAPPRRVHGAHPERRRAARARAAGARAGHRRLLPRLHQGTGRAVREPRLRRVAARRRRRPLRAVDGVHRRPLLHAGTAMAGTTLALPRERDGGAPARRTRAGWTETIEYARRRPAAARRRARLQPRRSGIASRRDRAAGAADAQSGLDRAVGRSGRQTTASAAGGARCSKRWPGRRRSRCTRAAWPSRAASRRAARRCSKSATASPATSTTRWRRASARS